MADSASSETMGRSASSQTQRPLALITGASAGLGEALAEALAARGYDLALVARRADRLESLAARLSVQHGVQCLVIAADLSLFEAHLPILQAVADAGRHVDLLVNNAGFGVPQSFAAVPWDRQRDFLMTLVVSVCGLAHGVIPGMVARRRGSIINIASIAAFSPGVAGNTLYPGAKSLVVKFSQALDAEYRGAGLKITAVCPGSTKTEFADKAGIRELMDEQPSPLPTQTAAQVVAAALAGNDRGRVVVTPGLHNRVAVFLMRRLPEALVRTVIGAGAKKYKLER